MKTLVQEESIKVPKGVKISIKSKIVEVTGKHGSLKRDFKHMPIELSLANSGHEVRAKMYFAKSKQLSMLRSVCSHINNLFDGVQKKYEYKMRLVYTYFPINTTITNGGKTCEIRNFLGETWERVCAIGGAQGPLESAGARSSAMSLLQGFPARLLASEIPWTTLEAGKILCHEPLARTSDLSSKSFGQRPSYRRC
jgi:ribosomal protein L6P/L9E